MASFSSFVLNHAAGFVFVRGFTCIHIHVFVFAASSEIIWSSGVARNFNGGLVSLSSPSLSPFVPSLPAPFLSLPTLPFSSPLPSLRRRIPWNPASGSGGMLWAPPVGSGVEPQPKLNLMHFSFKRWDLVATILNIFPKMNWPNWQILCSLYVCLCFVWRIRGLGFLATPLIWNSDKMVVLCICRISKLCSPNTAISVYLVAAPTR